MTNLLNKYHSIFPEISSLFDYQEKVLTMLAAQQNTLAIIPTGGGKSLIYQLAALELTGITIVVSPLLALMEEQVNELNSRNGIQALALNSNKKFIEQRQLLRNLNNESYKFIYVSPERLQNPFFRACLIASLVKISLVVVDEAHCISQWGSSFRPDYAHINSFVEFLNKENQNPFLFCLTATLSKEARKDIIDEFKIADKQVFVAEKMIRDNLKLHFQKVNSEEEKAACLKEFLIQHRPQKSIAYLYSKRECERYADLFSQDYSTEYFHSAMESDDKYSIYSRYLDNKIQILFATTAFGMGINIPDIESVIHIHIPNSIEEYYQQVGRGWRKKAEHNDCQCLALWSDVNFDRRKKDLEKQKYNIDLLKQAYKVLIGSAKITKIGQVVNKDKDAILNSDYNLPLLKYKFEKHGILRTIGEINGTPLSIELINDTALWNDVKRLAESGIDSFRYVSNELNISILDIIHHLYQQDLEGNIRHLPAMKKDIFFEVLTIQLEDAVCEDIVKEINEEIDFRIRQLSDLNRLFDSVEYTKILKEVLK